ncbi:probable sulfatase atsG [Lentisphaera araneosa HTCC2155]|uniref:Probable sulfatase atsG n=1 Tax=Lentisphaera araneosa HTCC2155 TaxID=313628 RepID=A6DJ71_9BACT|nr:sulfatase-like hydrolase/transferase [Lentisphaera araneosa]EDM28507.1 probable sulfatase atsG [Lentisphaera araneosa HTCC2155]
MLRKLLVTWAICASSVISQAFELERPNILWLTSEDNNASWLGCYGNENAKTPNLDKLAADGFLYENTFANAPVCAPSRCTWLTGVNAVSMGTHPMRSSHAIPYDKIKLYPQQLQKAGYFTANGFKTDYNLGSKGRTTKKIWDFQSKKENKDIRSTFHFWRLRKKDQPFFCVINTMTSHESKAHGLKDYKLDPAKVQLAKYHPDTPIMRQNYSKYHDQISKMDTEIGYTLKLLEEDGLADDTIVIYCSDHGGVLPRSKRFLFESGIHAPLIIRIPEKYKHLWPAEKRGARIKELVSFVDMPKTWLSITGSEIPQSMQGRVFLGKEKEAEAEYHFSFRGRMDERVDNERSVRKGRYTYIRNYMPFAPRGAMLNYLWKMPAAQSWVAEHKAGNTNEVSSRFFHAKTHTEELYDRSSDSDNINNLIDHPEFKEVAVQMRKALRNAQEKYYDAGLLPEYEMLRLAEKHNTSMYDLVRDPKMFNHAGCLDAIDVALAKDPANLEQLIHLLEDQSPELRYWGAMGLLLLEEAAKSARTPLIKALNDESDHVRIIAAWALLKIGDADKCYETIGAIIEKEAPALLFALNVLDWMGEQGRPLAKQALASKAGGYVPRMQMAIAETLGLEVKISTGKKDKKSKKKKK